MSDEASEIERLRARVEELEAELRGRARPGEDPVTRSILEASPDSVMMIDRGGKIRFINQTVPELTVEQVIGTYVFDYVTADHHPAMRECFARVFESGAPDRYETVYHHDDGSLSLWEARVGAVKNPGGDVSAAVILASNVTDRRQAAAERDRFFMLTLEFFVVASLEGYFLRVNPAFCRSLGWSEDELLSRPFAEFVHPDDLGPTAAAMEALSEGRDVIDFVNRYRCKDGSLRYLSWRATVDPETKKIYATSRDVTERLSLEQQLRHSQKMDAVGQLAGGIAHDFNNLLLVMMAHVDLALLDPSAGDSQERMREIKAACERARELTGQLLTFSRRQPLRTTTIDIVALTDRTLSLLMRVLPENIEVHFSSPHEIPVVQGDEGQLEQILMNLAVNARDAMAGGGVLSVKAEATKLDAPAASKLGLVPGQYVRWVVADSGMGFDDATRARAFEPFFTTKPPGQGTGLGLSTAYGIAQRHDGTIYIDPDYESGARFEVYLPAEEGEAAPSTQPPPSQPGIAESRTILLAEDQPQARDVVSAMLERAGFRVIAGGNGREVVDLFEKHGDSVDLLLFDVVMPVMSGPEAYAAIAEVSPDIPVVFSSGYSENAGGTPLPEDRPLLHKPYSLDELLETIHAALEA